MSNEDNRTLAILRYIGIRVVPVALAVIAAARSKHFTVGLQKWIAKGRKQQKRGALAGNFAPVREEVVAHNLPVEGSIPKELEGAYLRNGSNPRFDPYASYHWFEGDGVVHTVRIKNGKVSYSNRFVRTSRFLQEEKFNGPLFAKFGDQEGVRGLFIVLIEALKAKSGVIDTSKGDGTANTSIVYHAGKLLAMHEGDLPYQIRVACDGVMSTVTRLQVAKGSLEWKEPFTAHPKIDPDTGKMHFLGYYVGKKPWLQYGILSADGVLEKKMELPVPWNTMMHDMAITKKFAVFFHVPLVFEPEAMIKNNSLPMVYHPELPARIGLLPLEASSPSAAQWFELPSFMLFHIANAWDEPGGIVKVFGCQMNSIDMGAQEYREDLASYMTEYTLDTNTGKATSRRICNIPGDFPVVHPNLIGRKTCYTWTGTNARGDKHGRFGGIAKLDLINHSETQDACVARISYGPGRYGGEAVFVPRHEEASKNKGEDDGFLLVYVFDEAEQTSFFEVYDAQTMEAKPLAKVRLPQRVPYGFHGAFVSEQCLKKQMVAV